MTKVVLPNGEFSDDGTAARDMRNYGYMEHLLPLAQGQLMVAAQVVQDRIVVVGAVSVVNSAVATAVETVAAAATAAVDQVSDLTQAAVVAAQASEDSAVLADTAREDAVDRASAAAGAAAMALDLRDQTQVIRDETQAIKIGDITGTGPAQFTNNAGMPAFVRAVPLTGLSLADASDVAATDSVLVAVGKLQAQADLGITSIVLISTNTTAVYGVHYVLTSSLVLTLPTPSGTGKKIAFTNLSGTETATVVPGTGGKVRGVTGTMTIDSVTASAVLTDSGAAQGWV